jgi:4-aminobutyrate aminotransferase-like enzyme
VRGAGMMVGIEMVRAREGRTPAPDLAGRAVVECLRAGVLVLGGGIHGNVLSLSPPFVITESQLAHALDVLVKALRGMR